MYLRPCLLVPVFNNPKTLSPVVTSLIEETELPILVVDDGSGIPASTLLPPSPRVSILRQNKNQGKGSALRLGFQELIKRGFTHALTFDADGQHLASEVPKLLSAMHEDPWALIIGKRDLNLDSVPPVSRFGRVFSNFWVKYETEIPIKDSQSGLRLYPLFHLQTLSFFCKRYDFEIEVLIRLLWKRVRVKEVEVKVAYSPIGRVSHFKKGRDNLRISLLNIGLVFFSLLAKHRTPTKLALAVGLGIWIGTTPFFGFHSVMALALSLAFGLNFIACWVGTQVSLPIFAPFLTMASVQIGKFWKDSFFEQWLLGSVILGSGLGLLGGGITYLLTQSLHNARTKPKTWSGKMRGGKFGNWFLKKVLQTFGLKAAYACLYFIVPYFYFFSPNGRKGSEEYLKVVYPKASWFSRQFLVLKHYFEFGKVLLDRLYQNAVPKRHFETVSKGAEHIASFLESDQSVLLVSAHVGSWTLAAHYMHYKKKGDDFLTVEFAGKGASSAARSEQIKNVLTNQIEHSVLELKRLLEEGKPMGLMGDRPRSKKVELVPFLGKLMPFDCTPFYLASVLGVPVLFTFGFRHDHLQYRFFAELPKAYAYVPGKPKDLQMYEWVSEFAKTVESYVLRYRFQWFNFYRVFSTPIEMPR